MLKNQQGWVHYELASLVPYCFSIHNWASIHMINAANIAYY